MSTEKPVLGYWKMRGLAHPIRMLLHYKEADFVNKMYEQGDAPEYNKDSCTVKSKIRNDMIYSLTVFDLYRFFDVTYSDQFETLKTPFLESLESRVEKYSKYLAQDEFFGDSELVYADFCAYSLLDVFNQFKPGCVDSFSNLKAYMSRMSSLPTLKSFLNSEEGMKYGPFNSKYATYGGKSLQ
ncbi:GSTM3 [Bugula neritina]|uniref:glutathione transferase n=1 Tax=Bugula neritina TaxID=10212 RepID=A0A7J7J878_BUGNE|nr:GSTM3 [Bugula neritina]